MLLSIQSLILVPEPYFNEPGYERSMGTESVRGMGTGAAWCTALGRGEGQGRRTAYNKAAGKGHTGVPHVPPPAAVHDTHCCG